MSNLAPHNLIHAVPLPAPRCKINVRSATTADLAFIDSLQKMHSHMVGWFPMKQFEGHISQGNIAIAEDDQQNAVGYCLSRDQYMKRDDVGIIYQLNIAPLKHRSLIGATLVKSVFDKAAYGCRLFCCWCAQDIQANWFWESIGFVPLAFRAGSRGKQRIHIFWQKRIREGDDSTPYWFPSQTHAGAVRENRIVLPIPPGTHWRDAKPLVLPGMSEQPKEDLPKTLPGGAPVRTRPAIQEARVSKSQRMAIARSKSAHLKGLPPGKAAIVMSGGIRYIDRGDYTPEPEPDKVRKPRAPRQKNNPEYVKAARELRDRFLDRVNAGLILPGGQEQAAAVKYDVSRQLQADSAEMRPPRLLTESPTDAAR
jgi:hypothetical protein